MCGIALLVGEHEAWPGLEQVALSKGAYTLSGTYTSSSDVYGYVNLAVGVLSLRGNDVPQPLTHSHMPGCYLAWNGEIFECDAALEHELSGKNVGVVLMDNIARAVTEMSGDIAKAIVQTLARIEGPYAFVLLDTERHRVFYGRDHLGRRSLLQSQDSRCLVSAGTALANSTFSFREVDCTYIWEVDTITQQVQRYERNSRVRTLLTVCTASRAQRHARIVR